MFINNDPNYSTSALVEALKNSLELPITNEFIVNSVANNSTSLNKYHNKHVLACCQDDVLESVKE